MVALTETALPLQYNKRKSIVFLLMLVSINISLLFAIRTRFCKKEEHVNLESVVRAEVEISIKLLLGFYCEKMKELHSTALQNIYPEMKGRVRSRT